MKTISNDMALDTWKRQLECAATAIEAIAGGFMRVHEAQLRAACEACAGARALRERITGAGDAQAIWRLHGEWAQANFHAALDDWRELAAIGLETQSSVAECMSRQALPYAAPAVSAAEEPQRRLVEIMDSAYKRWLESTQQFYAAPVIAAPQIRQPA